MRNERTTALLQTGVTAVLWGTSFPVITVGIGAGLDPEVFAFLRFAIAAAPMLAVCSLLGKGMSGLLRSRAVWILAFFNAVGFVCQFVGQAHTSAAVASLLVNLSVVLAATGGAIFLGERMGAVKVIGVLAAFAGTVLLATKGDLALVTGGQLFGDSLYIVAAIAWACYIVYAKKKTDETKWDPVAVAAAIVTVTAVFLLPVALTASWGGLSSAVGWETVTYTALFNTALAFTLYQAGLRHLSASASAVVLVLEIVTAVAISTAFLGEVLNAFSWVGAALVIVSVLLVSLAEGDEKRLSVPNEYGGGARIA